MPHAVDHHAILNRLAALRGVGNVFSAPDPKRTAHVIVDLQNGFMEEGAPVEVPMARHIVDEVNLISRALRDAGGTNIFLRYTTPPDWENHWTVFWERMGPAAAGHREAFTPGNPMHALWAGLDVQPGDIVVDKHRFSGFFPDTSSLPALLRDLAVDTLIISGTLTNCCCESTARDAMQAGYRVIMAADANAALSDEEHRATLHNMAFVFADLLSAREIAALWRV